MFNHKKNIIFTILIFAISLIQISAKAQDKKGKKESEKKSTISKQTTTVDTTVKSSGDLFAELDKQNVSGKQSETDLTTATFKTTRLINGHSIENVAKGVLDVKISHRFGTLNEGAYAIWGLDAATMRMGVDYGITNRLMVGIGRSEYQKTYDGFFKYRMLRQSTGKVNMPISVSYVASMHWKTIHFDATQNDIIHYTDRLTYAHQLIIARKMSDYFSLQVVPTLVHYNNSAPLNKYPNDYYSIGIGARQRITKRVNLTAEYYPRITKLDGYVNSFSLGVDIETGGHVFQLNFSNSTGINERAVINETLDTWEDGGIHFGFNIARVFTIKKAKKLGW